MAVVLLRAWSGKHTARTVFDSDVDEFTVDGLFDKLRGKRNVALVVVTEDGDVFGVFYRVAVTEQWKTFFDPNIFIFSFESHGRCRRGQRFVAAPELTGDVGVEFGRFDPDGWLVLVSGCSGALYLGNDWMNTHGYELSGDFEGLEDTTLTGAVGWDSPAHSRRFLALQLS